MYRRIFVRLAFIERLEERVKVRPFIAWYDLWVGAYWDVAKRRLYLMPVPCIGIVVDFNQTE
jgi:hypothetical protein